MVKTLLENKLLVIIEKATCKTWNDPAPLTHSNTAEANRAMLELNMHAQQVQIP
jgi:hypothetical protein